jgi:hypothetical protein
MAADRIRPTSRPLCQDVRNTRRRQNYAEKTFAEKALLAGDQRLIAHAVTTPGGQAVMPDLAKTLQIGSAEHFQTLVNNFNRFKEKVGRAIKNQAVEMLIDGLPTKFCKGVLDMSSTEVYAAKKTTNAVIKEDLTQLHYPHNVTRQKLNEPTDRVFRRFFHETTHVASGQKRDTRILGKNIWEWERELSVNFPSYLRQLAFEEPTLVPSTDSSRSKYTMFEANMLAAVASEAKTDFDPQKEAMERSKEWTDEYQYTLGLKRNLLPERSEEWKEARQREQSSMSEQRKCPATFDAGSYKIIPPAWKTFQEWLKREGLRYTRFTMPHPCPICDSGPIATKQVDLLQKEAAELQNQGKPIPDELVQKLRKARKQADAFTLHTQQLEHGRAETKRIENALKPGECLVIRDFVNHHDHSGSHVKCLHWVVMWRDEIDGPIKILKLRHYCSDKESMMTDSFYTADVMDFHFDKASKFNPGIFDKFTRVYFVGDHGPHFASCGTMFNESKSFYKYGKEIVLKFYTSYHAFGRADAAGAQDSIMLRQDKRNNFPRHGAEAMTAMTNSSNDVASWAYNFKNINRDENLFPKGVEAKGKHLKKWSEVSFEYEGREESTVGVCKYRLVSGQGDWIWCDLAPGLREEGKEVCESCSTKKDTLVCHKVGECPEPTHDLHSLPSYRFVEPNPARINNQNQKQRPRLRGEKETRSYKCTLGCKTKGGRTKAFRCAKKANEHYRVHHELSGDDYAKVAYPVGEGQVMINQAVIPDASRYRLHTTYT